MTRCTRLDEGLVQRSDFGVLSQRSEQFTCAHSETCQVKGSGTTVLSLAWTSTLTWSNMATATSVWPFRQANIKAVNPHAHIWHSHQLYHAAIWRQHFPAAPHPTWTWPESKYGHFKHQTYICDLPVLFRRLRYNRSQAVIFNICSVTHSFVKIHTNLYLIRMNQIPTILFKIIPNMLFMWFILTMMRR